MQNNRQLTVYTARSRKDAVLQETSMGVWELFERLRQSQALAVTHGEYMSLRKPQQDDLKDIGGYISGQLKDGRRRKGCTISRAAAVLDADNLPAGGTEHFAASVAALGCCYCIHSTAKHSPQSPRLRVVIPFSTDIPAEQYPVIVRLLCQMIQSEMSWFDRTSIEAGRLMFWSAHCKDVEPVFYAEDKPFLDPVRLLDQAPDWKNPGTWPRFPGEAADLEKLLQKRQQQDPESKTGIVGAFCRAYDIPAAMDKFLPGVYESAGEGRYTFAAGSTYGGAVVYDNGKFLYSHHATDPCGGQLVNAWDLVRLHRFGELDDGAKEGARGNRLPSYSAMCELALADKAVKDEYNLEQQRKAAAAFGPAAEGDITDDVSWMRGLTRSSKGNFDSTLTNVLHVLENDPLLKDRIYHDTFADKTYGVAPLPWGNHTVEEGPFQWKDADDDGLCIYLERLLGFRSPNIIRSAFNDHLARCMVNPVADYLNALQWDGRPRLDTMLIDYMGAKDTPYTRAVTRKAFTAAVARAMMPGSKYDTMLIMSGPQGAYKSTLLSIMGGPWFTDSIQTFNGKEAVEALQGVLIVEIAELQAFSNADVNRIKQFISTQNDRYRAAYGRRVEDHPRKCVFFGTTNSKNFLRDPTGGRRFWPVYTGEQQSVKNVGTDLAKEREQLWAEAVVRFKAGEPLYLSGELWEEATRIQEYARENDPREGLILDFLERPVPKDWASWPLDRRKIFWSSGVSGDLELVPRERICALEVWCELFEKGKADAKQRETRAINAVLDTAPGWRRMSSPAKFGPYGSQRGFESVADP